MSKFNEIISILILASLFARESTECVDKENGPALQIRARAAAAAGEPRRTEDARATPFGSGFSLVRLHLPIPIPRTKDRGSLAIGARALDKKRVAAAATRASVRACLPACLRACVRASRNGTENVPWSPAGAETRESGKRHIYTRTHCHGVNVNDACRAYYVPSLSRSEVPVIYIAVLRRETVAG